MRLPTGFTRTAVPLLTAALLAAATVVPGAAGADDTVPTPTPVATPVPTVPVPSLPAALVPRAKTFRPVADDPPRAERESSCSPTEKPGAFALRTLLRRTYGTKIASNTVRKCTAADSGHEEGRAVDWMTSVRVPEQRAMAEAFIGWLQATDQFFNPYAMARRLGVEYIIWNNRIWRTYDPGRGWTQYGGCLAKKKAAKKFDTACHRNHVHVSLSWDGAYNRTSYFGGYVACPSFPTAMTAPALTTEGLDFVAVPPARLLSTWTGSGAPNGPCRLRAGTRFDLPVLGRGGVPDSGVSAVVLRVALAKPDASTTLRVWPAGTAAPVDPVVAANPGQGAALVTVPLGTSGMVSIQDSGGMSHVSADVVGYYLAPGLVGDRFHPIGSTRVVSSQTIAAKGSVTLDLTAASGVDNVHAGLLSVSVAGAKAAGTLVAYPPDSSVPPVPGVVFATGDAQTSSMIARSAGGGQTILLNTSTSPVTVTVDLQGVYAPAAIDGGMQFVPLAQNRLVNTQKRVGLAGALAQGVTASFAAVGVRGVPATGVGAVLLYGMAVKSGANTVTTLWPEGTNRPTVRQISPRVARPSGDMVAVRPGATGRVAVRNQRGTTDLVVDVAGYFR
ncbi:MAG: hypothetical protein ACXV2I_00020 [Actinomycetes bacterium]